MSEPKANPASLDALAAADAAWTQPQRSLAPGREQATSAVALYDSVREHAPNLGAISLDAWVTGFTALIQAVQQHFPENLFLDFDALATASAREGVLAGATIVHERGRDATAAARISEVLRVATNLQTAFGGGGPVGFRYTHDYIYGFDWARWVAAEPQSRAAIGPYDLAFQVRMAERGEELAVAIASGQDADYPQLEPGTSRNPFSFKRTPEAEAATLKDLASRAAIPVEAWSPVGRATWSRPFAKIREGTAR